MPDNSISDYSIGGTHKRKLSAIMFTDIKGFSSLMESDEVTAVELVKAQREIVRKYIPQYEGEERETIGDAFLVIFDSAVNAVRCAIDIQREIWEFNQTREPENQVWIRIGIHLGDILIEEGSVFGEGVNLAARVEPLAEPGGICITRQVFDQVKHHLDISVTHLGVRELKNITDIPDIYRIRLTTTAPREPVTIGERLEWFTETPLRVAVSAGVLLIGIAAGVYWSLFAIHTTFARQTYDIRHAPRSFDTISRSDADGQNLFYVLSLKGGKTAELKKAAKPVIPPEDADRAWEFGLSRKSKRDYPVHKYSYDGGDLKEEVVEDLHGVPQYKLIYEQGGRVATVHDQAGYIRTFENQIAGYGYDFDEKGRMTRMENRNAFGMPRNDNDGVASYRYEYGESDLPAKISAYDSNGNPVEDKYGVAAVVYTYNDMGLVVKEEYLDRYGNARESTSGVASIEKSYDGEGRLVLEKYLDRAGQPVLDNDGACAKKFTYDSEGRLVETTTLSCAQTPRSTQKGFATRRYKYDGDRVVGEFFYDEKGFPTPDDRGVASVKIEYDENGRISSTAFFDAGGKAVTDENHVHAFRYFYDSSGRPSRRVFIGVDNNPAIGAQGFAEARVQYNDRGDAVEWAYFDTQGQLINGRDGYAVVRNNFDQFGNLISKSFFDKKNEPTMAREDACHRIEMKYDDKGNLDETRCFDGNGDLNPGIKHCAISKYNYDALGKLTKFECYVSDGKLIDDPAVASTLTVKYDKRGYLAEVRAFDANGNPAERFQGAALWKRQSDDFGNQIEIATYDRNGNLINNPKYKAAIFRRKFDDKGRELGIQAFDQSGEPSKGIWGFAEIRYQYDGRGHKTSESYFDENGSPATNWQNVHEYRTSYDDNGRILEIANIGSNGEPVLNNEGVAFTRYTYDQWGWISRIEYFNTDRKPTSNARIDCVSQVYKTDDRGNVLEIDRLDADGNPCKEDDCTAVTKQEFDSKGKMTKQVFTDADGNPELDENGAAGYIYEYDVAGRTSVQHILDKNGNEGVDRDGIHEYRLNYNPANGKLWFILFADESGKPARSKRGADLRIMLYDPVYLDRQRAKADASNAGGIVKLECLDDAGNDTGLKNCVSAQEVKAEAAKIKPALTR